MREVQCSVCLQFTPKINAVHSFLTIFEKGTQEVKHSQKMYACCVEHHDELITFYSKRDSCYFRRVKV